jgi:hypothetical protein
VVAVSGFVLRAALGHGDGTFDPPQDSFDPPSPQTIVSADLDGDGVPDLVVSQNLALDVLLGNGDGTFRKGTSYAAETGTGSYAAADFGNKGRIDVALVGFSAVPDDPTLRVLRGYGDGTLKGHISYAHGSPVKALVSGDFQEDGREDVAFLFNYGFDVISIAFGGPRGRFVGGGTFGSADSLFTLATTDLDGDGHLDLATLAPIASAIAVFLGKGDGTFDAGSSMPVPSVSFYSSLRFADLNNDGFPDAVVLDGDPNRASDQLAVLLGNGDGTLRPALTSSFPSPVSAIAVADLDEDGFADIAAVANSSTGQLFIRHGNGNGTFGAPTIIATGQYPISIAAADLVENGHTDLAVGHASEDSLWIFPGNGNGTFGEPDHVDAGGEVVNFVVSDFQEDGHGDVLAAGYQQTRILYGHGDGTFEAPIAYATGFSSGIATGDFDGDGTLDAVVANYSSGGGFELLLNARRAATLPPEMSATTGQAVTLIAQGSGLGAVSYQWRKGGVPLSDGGPISGAATPTLTINPVSFADVGSYDVVVTDDCGSVTSNTASLSVEFADVPVSSPFHDDIIAIATAGITGGCGNGNYCPTSPVRRDQMAVFLLKAEHGSAYTPPACTGVFPDVLCPGPFTDWVEQLAAEGVTGGCGGGNYCPDSSVTRAQMAIFLLKTSQGSSYAPPTAVGIFGDVPVGSFGADFIEDLYNRSITGGCQLSPLLYCPGNAVLRQQMATFLVRTFFP